jgi:hypothetical protein
MKKVRVKATPNHYTALFIKFICSNQIIIIMDPTVSQWQPVSIIT